MIEDMMNWDEKVMIIICEYLTLKWFISNPKSVIYHEFLPRFLLFFHSIFDVSQSLRMCGTESDHIHF